MRGEPVFLGVYVKTSDSDSGGGITRWHAWGLPDGNFLLQEAPQEQSGRAAAQKPGEGVKRLSVEEFFTDYRVHAAFSASHKPSFPKNPPAAQPQPAKVEPDLERSSGSEALRPEPSGPKPSRPETLRFGAEQPAPQAGPASAPDGPPAAAAPGASAMPGSDHTDLVSYLTQGLGESGGRDYVIVRGEQRDDGRHSNFQAQEVITFEEDDGSLAVPMSEEEAARIEQGFRTEFSLALIRLKSKRGDALTNLEQLAKSEGPFAREHKFMFSDCGTALRRRNLYVLAQQFHERARELAPDDEHVLFNLARVLYECGKTDKARECLAMSVEMAPDFQAGKDFLAFLEGTARS